MNSLELKQACLQVKEASKFLGILDTKAKNKIWKEQMPFIICLHL